MVRRALTRIEGLSADTTSLVDIDPACERPGIGPIISSATVVAIGGGDVFSKGRDFAAWLGLVLRQISTGTAPSSARYPRAAIVTWGLVRAGGLGGVDPAAKCADRAVSRLNCLGIIVQKSAAKWRAHGA